MLKWSLSALKKVFPGNLLSATHVDPQRPGEVIGCSEVKRRETYMKKLEVYFDAHPILVELVTNCLHNNPQNRPSAEQLLATLQPLHNELENIYGGNLVNVAHVLHIKETRQKDKRIKELEVLAVRLESENRELTTATGGLTMANVELTTANRELTTANRELTTANRDLITANIEFTIANARLEAERETLETTNLRISAEKHELETHNTELQTETDSLKSEIHQLNVAKNQLTAYQLQQESEHKQEKLALQLEVERLQDEIQRFTLLLAHTKHNPPFLLQLDWRHGPDMPVAMSNYLQSVEINGIVYVGGGGADSYEDVYIVMAYNTESCQWHSLPPYNTNSFAMAAINNKLVLVGGYTRNNSYSNELGEWQPDSNQWTHPFPPMPTPRSGPSATSHKHWLVVAGGWHKNYLQVVEVLDVSNMQWSSGPYLPIGLSYMMSITIKDTWYLMGGISSKGNGREVYSVSLEALVLTLASYTSGIWKKLCPVNCTNCSPLKIGESLLAVGGYKDMKASATIQCYHPEANIWVQAGQLHTALFNCTCIMTASHKLLVIGGNNGETRVRTMFSSIL